MKPSSRIWPLAAAFTTTCGAAVAVGAFLTWVTARGSRPAMGMDHTSLSGMLVWSLERGRPFWESVGFAVLVLGVIMVVGALAGLRTLTAIAAVLALVAAAMWLGLTLHHFNAPNQPNSYYLNPARVPWSELRPGAWLTICGGVLGLLTTPLLRRWWGRE